jgi:hypothetical protein
MNELPKPSDEHPVILSKIYTLASIMLDLNQSSQTRRLDQ